VSGGRMTTASPARTPRSSWRSSFSVMPGFTVRCCTLSSAITNTTGAPSRSTTALAGTRTPCGLSFPPALACSRKLTRTPISGTMRGSFCLRATRTFTVALPRSAVGTMAITSAGIFQSG